ncbi:hypothetical protein CLU96_1234 [Chryseobacterium sp. 52]|uniref:hypothetical protein n=1 Tax=Chryseobacterium sp. 52 TaxID=2035213 RepID=UPI000C17F58C|nr:hypothetical protein [Chryseobacterium sp. 52]PIF44293.1 hypothetical protein CLU96_1234 [Chryseobacterium sp. 52]
MEIKDLIKAGKDQVRRNPDLMSAYIELFQEKFGKKPDCAGCSFNSDWNRLINETSTQKFTIMSTKNFELINNSIIYSFDYEDKKLKRVFRKRVYGNLMTEDFAIEYLTHGTQEEIAVRKKQFRSLPEKFQIDLEKLDELKNMAAERGYPEEEYNSIDNDSDMSAYIAVKDLEHEAETKRLQEAAEERMKKEREEKAEAEEARLAKQEADRIANETAVLKAKEEEARLAIEKEEAEAAEEAKNKAKEKNEIEGAAKKEGKVK